ncbi:hypothetical protein ACHAWF_006788 [Thalassiosira exigua]
MPHPSELEEFGLEVERELNGGEERERRPLVGSGPPSSAAAPAHAPARGDDGGDFGFRPRRLPLHVSTPPKDQRSSLLRHSSNFEPLRKPRPGTAKWAAVVLLLAVAALLYLSIEQGEAEIVESSLPDNAEACRDDDVGFAAMTKAEESCADYLANRGPNRGSCDAPLGIPDEDDFRNLLKHFCRKSCGRCGTEDAEGSKDPAEIEAEVEVVAEEIEAKEEEEAEEIREEVAKVEQALREEEEEKKKVPKEVEEGEGGDDSAVGDDGSEPDAKASGAEADAEARGASAGGDEGDEGSAATPEGEDDAARTEAARGGGDAPPEPGGTLDDRAAGAAAPRSGGPKKSGKTSSDATPAPGGDGATGGTFAMERLRSAREAARALVDALDEYYGGADKTEGMLLGAWLDPWSFDAKEGGGGGSAARDRADKLVDTMARALVTEGQEEFVIGTIGSSVAAGHDNCAYDSYENQLERTFGPVWEAAGMKLVCQNAGEGGGCGDDYRNQAYCVKQNVSPDVDVVHYTWTYFEEGDRVDKFGVRESLIRWTQMMPRQPPVHVLNALLRPEKEGAEQEYEIAERYAKYGYNAFYMKTGFQNGGAWTADVDNYAWGHVGDGYHNTTVSLWVSSSRCPFARSVHSNSSTLQSTSKRYGETEDDPDRKKSLGVVMRNWHPGPLGFQLVSDAFAYVYSKAMLAALDAIEERLKQGDDPREVWSASKRKVLVKSSLPEPKYCDPSYCVVNEAPGCLNYEEPTYGVWGPRVEDPDDELNPHRGEVQKWEVWHEPNDIWHMVNREDVAFFQDRDDKEICRHSDRCGGISATSADNGMVVFRLPKMEVGLVAICGCCGKKVAEEMFLNNTHLEVRYNGAVLNSTTWDIFPTAKCVRLLKKFPTGGANLTPTGHAYLSVKVLDGLSKTVRISHVLTL